MSVLHFAVVIIIERLLPDTCVACVVRNMLRAEDASSKSAAGMHFTSPGLVYASVQYSGLQMLHVVYSGLRLID